MTFRLVQRFARVVLGYHGCLEPFASQVLTGEVAIDDWPKSRNPWDWLGEGVYFWEHAPERALRWAQERARRKGAGDARPSVVGAVIQLGTCFDLTNVTYTEMLGVAHGQVEEALDAEGKPLPTNRGGGEADVAPRRELDCLVINYCLNVSKVRFQTVRGAFWEGEPAFPGAMIRKESHVQIAVREPFCILGVFRPRLHE